MWTREPDDTVLDEAGSVVYFSLDRFVRDICLSDCCFICGGAPDTVPFNDEHFLPRWLLRRYGLFTSFLNLPNGTRIQYDRYTVPCCTACNTLMGRAIEEPVRAIVEGGYAAVQAHNQQHGNFLFYVWLGLIFLKTHLKDRKLRAHRDTRKGVAPIAEELQYNWHGLHYLHTLVRCFATGAAIHPSALGSFVAIHVQDEGPKDAFDFDDLYQAQSVMLRMGEFAFLAAFNDGGGAALFLKQKLDRITGPVSGVQLRELAVELGFLNVHLKEHTELQSSFNLQQELHGIEGKTPWPELATLDYTVRGQFMHYLFRSNPPMMRSHKFSEAEIESQMLAGRLTFLFDENGKFFEDSNAPAQTPEPPPS
ncbi:hypothetical protein ACVWXM_002513 [Bradyrhizobium sp. GM7.3]